MHDVSKQDRQPGMKGIQMAMKMIKIITDGVIDHSCPAATILFFAYLTSVPAGAHAGKPPACSTDPCGDVECAKERTLCLLKEGKADEALDLLKSEKEEEREFTAGREFHLLMARAYLGQENHFWAINILNAYLADHPGDCEVKSWIAWIHLAVGDLENAGEILSDASCLEGEVKTASRFKMFETFLKIQEARKAGKDPVKIKEKKKKIKKVFPEDLSLYRYNRSILHPYYTMPLTIKTELAGGYTTNALMGSPSDPTVSKKMYSPLAYFDIWTMFLPPVSRWVNPSLELMARGLYYFRKVEGAESYPEQYSYMDAGIRPGFLFFKERYPRLLLAYKGNFLFINKPTKYQEETPVFFYEGHRGEFELEINPHLMLFGGAGKRLFDESIRTRLEFDGGVGTAWTLWGRLSILGAATVRYFKAENKGYNDFGVTGLIAATLTWYKGMQLRAVISLGLDNYMNSRHYFETGKLRKDTNLKVSGACFTPSWKGLKAGLVYEYSDKISTVSAYSYKDVRVMLKLFWYYSFDLWKPGSHAEKAHVPLDYGFDVGAGGEVAEKIQDLLRQDESVRRGSSCKD